MCNVLLRIKEETTDSGEEKWAVSIVNSSTCRVGWKVGCEEGSVSSTCRVGWTVGCEEGSFEGWHVGCLEGCPGCNRVVVE